MLEVSGLTAQYGRSQALWDVSLKVEAGEAVALLGPNAAGKSTTLNCISRLVHPTGGSIHIDGEDIRRWSARRVVETGVIQVPEGRQVFPFMSVRENLELGGFSRRARNHRKQTMDEVFEVLPLLKERRKQLAGTLSGGEQQMLAIGRALMARPRLLMLDEPSLGLSPLLVQRVFRTISELHSGNGLTILIVEQNVAQALRIVDRAYVLDGGKTVLENSADALQSDPQMKKAYLGIESIAEAAEHEKAHP